MGLTYFDNRITAGFKMITAGEFLTSLALGLTGIFIPIFLYVFFHENFRFVAFYYIAWSLLYGLSVCLLVGINNKIGSSKSLASGLIFGALFYMTLLLMSGQNYFYLIPLSIIFVIFHILLYWIPLHISIARFSDRQNRGRELSLLMAVSSLAGILCPVAAGFIISYSGFNALFILAIALYLASIFFYIKIPPIAETCCWSWQESWRHFFSKKMRGTVAAFCADGARDALASIVWPIFIFQLLKKNFLEVGMISTLVVGVIVLFELSAGRAIDKSAHKEKFLKIGAALYSLGFLFKVFIATAFQIFIVDVFHRISNIFIRVPFDTLKYEVASKQKHFIDEYIILHEMACNLGRALMLGLIIVALLFAELKWVFALGAFSSLFLSFLDKKVVLKN